MPSFKEVQFYLAGLWLLIRMDPRGFRYLDISDRGLNRSFWATVWCLPPMAISWLWLHQAYLRSLPPDGHTGVIFFVRLAFVEAANWIVPLVLAGLILLLLKAGDRFAAVVVTVNWLGVPASYLNALLIAIAVFLPGTEGLVSILWLVLMMVLIFTLARILRMVCGAQPLLVGTMTLVLLIPSMMISDFLQKFLGIYPV